MNLREHYDHMRTTAAASLATGQADLDLLLDSAQDTRRGITLLARPPAQLIEIIGNILADFRQVEPSQYYYPATDIHLTILSIISCYADFSLAQIDSEKYAAVLQGILQNTRSFSIRYSGLTASRGGIMLQGFPLNNELNDLREKIRKRFQESGLQQSIDQRYSIQTAHSTIIRFRNTLENPAELLRILTKYQHRIFGLFEIQTVELVYNDWYQRAATTTLLKKYALQT